MAKMKSKPGSISVTWKVKSPIGPAIGMIAKVATPAINPKKGAIKYKKPLAPWGIVSSLKIDFKPSAAR